MTELDPPSLPEQDEPAASPPTGAGVGSPPAIEGSSLHSYDLDADDGFEALDPRGLTLALVTGAIWWIVLTVSAGVAALALILINPLPSLRLLWIVLWLGFGLLMLLTTILIPRWRYLRTRYRVDALGLQIRSGLLWKSRKFLPRSRIQHTDVGRGPIEGRMGLAHLVVHTAGTHNAETSLPGLDYERALAIRRDLTAGGGDADGV